MPVPGAGLRRRPGGRSPRGCRRGRPCDRRRGPPRTRSGSMPGSFCGCGTTDGGALWAARRESLAPGPHGRAPERSSTRTRVVGRAGVSGCRRQVRFGAIDPPRTTSAGRWCGSNLRSAPSVSPTRASRPDRGRACCRDARGGGTAPIRAGVPGGPRRCRRAPCSGSRRTRLGSRWVLQCGRQFHESPLPVPGVAPRLRRHAAPAEPPGLGCEDLHERCPADQPKRTSIATVE